MKKRYSLATCLLLLAFTACRKDDTPEPVVDPLPYPQELETNKDLSVDPGDSFFDYCNGGAWVMDFICASASRLRRSYSHRARRS